MKDTVTTYSDGSEDVIIVTSGDTTIIVGDTGGEPTEGNAPDDDDKEGTDAEDLDLAAPPAADETPPPTETPAVPELTRAPEQEHRIQVTQEGDTITLRYPNLVMYASDDGWSVRQHADEIRISGVVDRRGGWDEAVADGFLDENEVLLIERGACTRQEGGVLLITGEKGNPVSLSVNRPQENAIPGEAYVCYEGSLARGDDGITLPLPALFAAGGVMLALLIALIAALLRRPKRRRGNNDRASQQDDPLAVNMKYSRVHNIGSRESQQDSLGTCAVRGGLFAVVADGMGGLKNGDVVSQKIVQTALADCANRSADELRGNLLPIVSHINGEVNRMLGKNALYKSGSTLIAVLAEPRQFRWVSVGDSRIYLYRGGRLIQINREHNYEAELLVRAVNQELSFQEAHSNPKKKSVASFIGMGSLKYVDEMQRPVSTVKGDRILLCTDGVFNTLSDAMIESILAAYPDVDAAAERLEEAVLQRQNPHQDNFTAIVISYE